MTRAGRCLTCQQAAYVDAHPGSVTLAGSPDQVVSVGLYDGLMVLDQVMDQLEERSSTCPADVSMTLDQMVGPCSRVVF